MGSGRDLKSGQFERATTTAAFDAPAYRELVDQDAAHRLGGGGEEMPPAVPVLGSLGSTSRRYASWTKAVA